ERWRLAAIAVLAVVVLGTLGAVGVRARMRQQADRDGATTLAHSDRPRVLTTKAERAPARVEQVLPGTATPLLQTAVYARTSGYLKRRLVDIGDRVEEGQLLAEIETPEVDGQLLQARAALAESKATLLRNKASEQLARVNLARLKSLTGTAALAGQEYDAARANHKATATTVP